MSIPELAEQLRNEIITDEGLSDERLFDVAKDLNELSVRAIYEIADKGDKSDIAFANAVLRIVKRVKEFEEL